MHLEDIFKEMCSGKFTDYWHIYTVTKMRLDKSYFHFVHDAQPYYTDHTIGHIQRILEKLCGLLQPHLPIKGVIKDKEIDAINLNLLMNATLWHDLGNICGPYAQHVKNIRTIFNGVREFLYDEPYAEWILKIAEAHSGKNAIAKVIDRPQVPIHGAILHPAFLAALLRISDEMDEDSRRIEPRVMSTVPKEHEAFWKFCQMNEAIIPSYEERMLSGKTFTSLKIKISAKIDKKEVWAYWRKGREQVIAIEEYIRRVDKINKERGYCNPFLVHAFYFRKIDAVDLCINIYDGDKFQETAKFVFDDSQGYDAFFSDTSIKSILARCKL